jgi:hypothetical protein
MLEPLRLDRFRFFRIKELFGALGRHSLAGALLHGRLQLSHLLLDLGDSALVNNAPSPCGKYPRGISTPEVTQIMLLALPSARAAGGHRQGRTLPAGRMRARERPRWSWELLS